MSSFSDIKKEEDSSTVEYRCPRCGIFEASRKSIQTRCKKCGERVFLEEVPENEEIKWRG